MGCVGGQIADEEETSPALFGAASGCPTLPTRALTWWRWGTVETIEAMAWSPDGKEILASEHLYEGKEALIGYDDSRKHCQRLAVYSFDGLRLREILGLSPGFVPVFPGSMSFMSSYAIVHMQNDAGLWTAIRVGADGQRKQLAVWPNCHNGRLTPSPDGKVIAAVDTADMCAPAKPSTTRVSFFDAAGNPT